MESDFSTNILKNDILKLLYEKELSDKETTEWEKVSLTQEQIYSALSLTDNDFLHMVLEDLLQDKEIDVHKPTFDPPLWIIDDKGRKSFINKTYVKKNIDSIKSTDSSAKKIQHEILDVLEKRRIEWQRKSGTKNRIDQPMSIAEINAILQYGEFKISSLVFDLFNNGFVSYDKRVDKFLINDTGRTALYSKAFLIESVVKKSNLLVNALLLLTLLISGVGLIAQIKSCNVATKQLHLQQIQLHKDTLSHWQESEKQALTDLVSQKQNLIDSLTFELIFSKDSL